MNRTLEKAIGTALVLLLVAAGLHELLGSGARLASMAPLQPLAAWALLLAAVAFLRAGLARRAREEQQDGGRRSDDAESASLFAPPPATPFSAARTRDRFEHVGVPIAALAAAALLSAWAGRLWNVPPAPNGDEPLLAAAFLLGEVFALFLVSRYLIGLARAPAFAPARAPGIACGLLALAAIAAALAGVAAHLGWPLLDRHLARAFTALLALLAAEQLLLFLAALYTHPARRAACLESRLGAALTDPATWARGVAASLDYQFGVQPGHGLFLQLLQRAVLPLAAGLALLVYASTCFVSIDPGEAGIRERWGRPPASGWRLDAGAHLKAPWPFETVRRVPSQRVLEIQVGFAPAGGEERPPLILWDRPHYRDEDVFLAPAGTGNGDTAVSLVSLNIPIEYRVTNLLAYAYRHSGPDRLLRDAAYRAVTRALAKQELLSLLGPERRTLVERLPGELQRAADALGLGVVIQFVGLQGIHPPVPVAAAFQSVVGALEERDASALSARAYAASVAPRAAAAAERERLMAQAEKSAARERAAADAELFGALRAAHETAPAILRQDLRLAALAHALDGRTFAVTAHRGAPKRYYFDLKPDALPALYELAPFPTGDHP